MIALRRSAFFGEQVAELEQLAGTRPFLRAVLSALLSAERNLGKESCAFDPGRRLDHHKHDLRGVLVYRGTTGGEWKRGLRIFYIACEATQRCVVLEYGERRPGKPDDAYTLFAERLKSGRYDKLFVALEQQHAYWQIASAPEPMNSSTR